MQKRISSPKISFEKFSKIMMLGIVSFLLTCSVFANPVLDNITAGQVSVQQTPGTTVINQGSQQAILNWQSFNIGQGESTHFNQPVGGIALNRINPTAGASQIYGSLTATGQIILINPAGVYFGPSAYVNVGSLIASTANISDQNFLNGLYQFSKVDGYNGAIVNEGQIIAAQNGLIALVAPGVINKGMIQANLGKVVLASGEAFTLDFSGDQMINFAVTGQTTQRGIDKDGNDLPDGISNTGNLIANGGTIMLSAKAAAGVLDHVINLEGVVQTKSFSQKNGTLILSGNPSSGVVRVAAKINASGKAVGEKGGTVQITGHNILLDTGTEIDVSGDTGGGNVNVGGNYQGVGPLSNANAVVMAPNAIINANAITSGNGGNVILWSDNATKFYGTIYAQGGSTGGNGGFVETSGKSFLEAFGNVNTNAVDGTAGTWLLDPANVTITTVTANGTFDGSNFDPTSDNASIDVASIVTSLNNGGNVIINTAGAGTQNGDITLATAINVNSTSAGSLTLNADLTTGTIFLNNPITATGFALDVFLNGSAINLNTTMSLNDGGNVNFNAPVTLGGNSTVTSTAGNISFANTINGPYSLALNGDALFNGNVGTTSALSSLTSTGTLGLVNSITVATTGVGGITAESLDLTAGTTSTIKSGSGSIQLVQIRGTGANLALQDNTVASTGTVTVTGYMGLDSLITYGGAANYAFISNLSQTGSQGSSRVFNNLVTFNNTGGVTFLDNGGIPVSFSGGLNTAATTLTFGGTTISSDGQAMTLGNVNTIGTFASLATAGGAFTVGNITADPTPSVPTQLTINTGAGAMTLNGTLGAGNAFNSISLINTGATNDIQLNNQINTTALTVTAGRNILLNNTIDRNGVAATSLNLTATAGGITQAGAGQINVTNLTASSVNGITLNNANNVFTNLTLTNTTAGNILLNSTSGFNFNSLTQTGGNLTVTSGGSIAQVGAFNVSGTTNLTATNNSITLNNVNNIFTGTVTLNNTGANDISLYSNSNLNFGLSAVGGNLTVATNNRAITQSAGTGISVAGNTSFNSGANSIILNNQAVFINLFSGTLTLNTTGANDVDIYNSTNTTLGASNIGGDFIIELLYPSDLTQVGALNIGGTSTFYTYGGTTNLTNVGNVFNGAVNLSSGGGVTTIYTPNAILLGEAIVQGDFNLTSGGAITQNDRLFVSGVTNINAGNNTITLNDVDNYFADTVSITNTGANNVSLTSGDIINFATLSIGGNLTVVTPADIIFGTSTSTGGNLSVTSNGITQLGALSVAGTSALTSGFDIVLDNSLNNFVGAVSLTTTGGATANIFNNRALIFGTSSLDSTLTAAAAGSITQTGTLTVPGSASFTAGPNSIILNNASNLFSGAITLNNSGVNDISIANNAALALSALTVAGNFTVLANGAITQTGALGVTGTSSFSAGANAITLNNASNAFTGAVTLSNSGANAVAVRNNTAFVIGNVNVGQNLNLTSSSTIGQSGTINAATLTTSSVGGTTLTGANTVTGFNATNTGGGNISLVNTAGTLTVSGISQNTGATSVTNTGSLTTSGAITSNGGAINLTTISPDTSARVLTVGAGIQSSGGNITLNAANNSTGTATALIVNGVINSSAGSGGLLTVGGGTALNVAPVIGAGNVTFQGNGLDLTLGTLNFASSVNFTAQRFINVTGALSTSGGANLSLIGDSGNTGVGGVYIANGASVISSGDLTISGSNLTGMVGADPTAAIDIAAGSTVSAAGTVNLVGSNGNSNININSNVVTSSAQNINVTAAGSGLINLGATLATNGGSINFNNLVNLSTATTLTNAGINFANGISGNQNLILNSNTVSINGSLALNNITINGTGGNNSLNLNSGGAQNWNINSANGGSITGIAGVTGAFNFNTIQNITGGVAADTFTLNGGSIAGNLSGGAGTNTLVANNTNNTWNITGTNSGTVTAVGGIFTLIQNLTGGSANDTYQLSGGSVSGTISGGAGSNTIAGSNAVNNIWNITSADAGSLTNVNAFNSIQNLTGGILNNTFNFADNANVSGLINGTNLASINTLNYTAYTTDISAVLSNINDGAIFNAGATNITNYTNITHLTANDSNLNILTTPLKTINVVMTAERQGIIGDPIYFSGFTILNGLGNIADNTVQFNIPYILLTPTTVNINGVVMTFNNFTLGSIPPAPPVPPIPPVIIPIDIPGIIQQPITNAEENNNSPTSNTQPIYSQIYIVDQTVGDLLASMRLDDENRFKATFVDPYCSSPIPLE